MAAAAAAAAAAANVQTIVMPLLLFVQHYCGCTVCFPRQQSKILEICRNEDQIF
jgi:hypothetical protein